MLSTSPGTGTALRKSWRGQAVMLPWAGEQSGGHGAAALGRVRSRIAASGVMCSSTQQWSGAQLSACLLAAAGNGIKKNHVEGKVWFYAWWLPGIAGG